MPVKNVIGRTLTQRWLLWGGMVSAFFGVITALFFLTPKRSAGTALALVIGAACMLPWLVFTWIAPIPVLLVASKDTVMFEFRNSKYAADFATLNGTNTGVPKKQQ